MRGDTRMSEACTNAGISRAGCWPVKIMTRDAPTASARARAASTCGRSPPTTSTRACGCVAAHHVFNQQGAIANAHLANRVLQFLADRDYHLRAVHHAVLSPRERAPQQ